MSIHLDHVTQIYPDGTLAVDDVSLTATRNTMTALIGPSGSGKTTLLSILGHILTPTRGRVTIDGISPTSRLTTRRRQARIAWILQTTNSLPRRSALANAMLSTLAAGSTRPEASQAATIALSDLGLAHKLDRPVRELSGGETQRVGIARALAAQPAYLIADEPTGQLDRAATGIVLANLRTAARNGACVIIATHDPVVAAGCDRVIELRDGRMTCGP